MAQIIGEVSRTFNEYLLLPNRTRTDCSPGTVDLRTPLARHIVGEPSDIELRSPFTSAIMQAVSSPELAIALARNGGLSFLHHNQSIEDQAAAIRKVKNFKAGFVTSDTNVRPDDTLRHLVGVMQRTGHSTAAVTDDGSPGGRLLGLVTSRDFHPQRHDLDGPGGRRRGLGTRGALTKILVGRDFSRDPQRFFCSGHDMQRICTSHSES